jgi:hypothetical protein
MVELSKLIPTSIVNAITKPHDLSQSTVHAEDARLFAEFMNPKSLPNNSTSVVQVLNGFNTQTAGQNSVQNILSLITPNDPIKNMLVLADYSSTIQRQASALHISTSISSAFVSTTKGLLNNHE